MPTHTTSVPSKRFPSWLIILAALMALGALSIDMYLPSFGNIASDLGASISHVQLTLASFLIGISCGQLFYGPVSDSYGRIKPLYVGITLYTVASLLCALATQIEWLVFFRFLQGLGGCAGMVISRAVVRDKMGPEGSAKAFSMLMLVFGLAPILAPLIGGGLLIIGNWRFIFFALTVYGAVCLISTYRSMAETVDVEYAPKLALGRVLRQYWGLLRHKQFMSYVLCGGLLQAGMFTYISGSPFVLIELYGIKPQYFGFVFGINAIGLVIASQINSRLLRKHSSAEILGKVLWIPAGLTVIVLICLVLGFDPLWLLLLCFFMYLSCYGFVSPNTSGIALAQQGKQAGTASALMGTLQFALGMVMGVTMSLWHDDTAKPLVAMMAICSALSLVLYQCVAKKTR
jgi:DHA1 family bicyclomycin/chloramphenicol resistance-like MFS transporter